MYLPKLFISFVSLLYDNQVLFIWCASMKRAVEHNEFKMNILEELHRAKALTIFYQIETCKLFEIFHL